MDKVDVGVVCLCDRLGFHLDFNRDPREGLMWDGKSEAVRDQSTSNVIHDLCHWLVADPRRRTVPDFGLGLGPESSEECRHLAPQLLDDSLRSKGSPYEETLASLLGIAVEFHLGLAWRKTAEDHSWQSWKVFDWVEQASELERRGLMKDGRPTFL